MHRTRHRPLVTGEVTPRAATVFAVVLEAAAFAELWAWVNLLSAVLAVAATAFYIVVYTLWLKRTSTPEHRDRGGGRGRARAGGVVGGHRSPGVGAARAVRRDRHLDPAALLGPRHPLPRRLRRGPRAHAPRGGHPAPHRGADPGLHRAARGGDACCSRAVGHMGAAVPGRRARARRAVHRVRRAPAAGARRRAPPWRCSATRSRT